VGGVATFNGSVNGALSAPHLAGHLTVTKFSAENRRFDSLALDLDAAKNRAAVNNGVLQRAQMQTQFAASAGLDNWSPKPNQPLQATVTVRNGDLADAMALAGQSPTGYAGALAVDVNIGGTLGNPTGSANIAASNGKVADEPFDRIQARVNLSDQLITIPSASMSAGSAPVNLTAEFQHPRDGLSIGQVHAHMQSNQVDLGQVRTVQQQQPNAGGVLTLTADVRGALSLGKTPDGDDTMDFQVMAINADAAVRGLRLDSQ